MRPAVYARTLETRKHTSTRASRTCAPIGALAMYARSTRTEIAHCMSGTRPYESNDKMDMIFCESESRYARDVAGVEGGAGVDGFRACCKASLAEDPAAAADDDGAS